MADKIIQFGDVLTGTTQNTTATPSAPIFLGNGTLRLPNGLAINWPGGAHDVDLAQLIANVIVTAHAGTNPTLTTVVQGVNDPFSNNTTIATTALTAAATTITLAERTGIAQNSFALLIDVKAQGYEWVQVTSSGTTGAGDHTIVRARRGTTAKAFAVGSYLLFTNDWVTIRTNNATTTTLTTGAVDISTATATAPVTSVIDTQALGMTTIGYPVIRLLSTVGGTSTPTATYRTTLAGVKK
jgi:hypothetical protein